MAAYLGASVVLLGNFNPAIFQPEWFRRHDLLPSAEIDAAVQSKGLVLAAQGAHVPFESLTVDAIDDRWALSTTRSDWLLDLGPIARSIFDLLPHTPATVFGVNVNRHFPADDAAGLLGKWVPLDALGRLAGQNPTAGGRVYGEWEGYKMSLTVEPSSRLPGGVFLGQNFEAKLKGGIGEFLAKLAADWESILKRAKETQRMIVEREEAL